MSAVSLTAFAASGQPTIRAERNGIVPYFRRPFRCIASTGENRFTLEGDFSRFYCERALAMNWQRAGAIMKRADKKMKLPGRTA